MSGDGGYMEITCRKEVAAGEAQDWLAHGWRVVTSWEPAHNGADYVTLLLLKVGD